MIRPTIALLCTISILAVIVVIQRSAHAQLNVGPTTPLTLSHGIKHLALIMDGNRRWAKERNLPAWQGHQEGVKPLKMAVQFCLDHKIPYLSAWAFALQNFKRSPEELHHLFDIIAKQIATNEADNLAQSGVRLRFIGDRSFFPHDLVPLIDDLEEKTKHHTDLTLCILFCYSGREDIVDACKKIARASARGELDPETITPDLFGRTLWTSDIPDPDLVIRTGKGNRRLSNFMQYQVAYSELYFLECNWPEVTREHLEQAVTSFAHTQRNFGL